jgi:hypothetical protein
MKRLFIILLVISLVPAFESSASSNLNTNPSVVVDSLPSEDKIIASFIPMGSYTVKIVQQAGNSNDRIDSSGYINFTDCSTKAISTFTFSPDGKSRERTVFTNTRASKDSVEVISANPPTGGGEPVNTSLDNLYHDFTPFMALYSILNSNFVDNNFRGYGCSFSMIKLIGEVESKGSNNIKITFSPQKIKRVLEFGRDRYLTRLFESAGIVQSESNFKRYRALYPVPDYSTLAKNSLLKIVREGKSYTFTIASPIGAEFYRATFTPVNNRKVLAVPYTDFFEQIKSDYSFRKRYTI